ncbi:hypothetical protein SDC9_196073 [bioreactor metagenome]|uniref:Uncharacterized protein n=1 Tax=bioreactor metagenome TaxID=1076179 RepID=A0A645IC22_9ZZZZ
MGVGGDIGKLKAAGIGRDTGKNSLDHLKVQFNTQSV